MFKVPDLLHWIVVITEPSMVEEIRKAPENVLSLMDAVDDVSIFCPRLRCLTDRNVSRYFKLTSLLESI